MESVVGSNTCTSVDNVDEYQVPLIDYYNYKTYGLAMRLQEQAHFYNIEIDYT